MAKTISAEYDAKDRVLRLPEPLEGVRDHERLTVTITPGPGEDRGWMSLRACLPREAAEEMSRILAEAAAPDAAG